MLVIDKRSKHYKQHNYKRFQIRKRPTSKCNVGIKDTGRKPRKDDRKNK